jgi:SAM-dependent methyltransferase
VSSRTLYLDGEYQAKNPAWHVEESAWKASHIVHMLQRNRLSPATICDVGCGAGEVLKQLQLNLSWECTLQGYDVSPQALELAKSRANEKLRFCHSDFHASQEPCFELLLVLDVLEHLEDYFSFLRRVKDGARHKIFHIPLDLSAQTVLRKDALLKRRKMYGHLHYFTRETALETLRDAGYEILDYFYTSRANDLGSARGQVLLKIPRRLLFSLHQDFAVRLLGGFSLLVLAR